MEGRPLDQVAVREARERAEAEIGALRGLDEAWVAHLRLILRALDEGREASAPFAVVVADYKTQTQVESDPDYPMLGRIGWEEDPRPPQVRWRELDRLADFHATVSEPEGKNDAPR